MTETTATEPKPVTVTITTDRRPWTDTRPLEKGEVVVLEPDLAEHFIKKGWAVKGRKDLED